MTDDEFEEHRRSGRVDYFPGGYMPELGVFLDPAPLEACPSCDELLELFLTETTPGAIHAANVRALAAHVRERERCQWAAVS